MHAGRQARIPAGGALEVCQSSIGRCPAACFLVLDTVTAVTLIAQGDNGTPRLGLEHGQDAMQVTRRLARPIAVIGDLPAISVFVSADVARSQRQQQDQGH
jgi:hypothetical protein